MQGDFREMKRAVSLSLTIDVHEFLASKLEDETVVQSEAFFFFFTYEVRSAAKLMSPSSYFAMSGFLEKLSM